MSDDILDRRAIAFVPYEDVLKVLVGKGKIISAQPDEGLAMEGLRVISVHEDYLRRSFAFVVCHSSFDVVPEGRRLPELRTKFSFL